LQDALLGLQVSTGNAAKIVSGWDRVVVGQKQGSRSWEKALDDGWKPGETLFSLEEAAERGFAGNDHELRYHFNLPNTLQPSDLLAVSFGAESRKTDVASATASWPGNGRLPQIIS